MCMYSTGVCKYKIIFQQCLLKVYNFQNTYVISLKWLVCNNEKYVLVYHKLYENIRTIFLIIQINNKFHYSFSFQNF